MNLYKKFIAISLLFLSINVVFAEDSSTSSNLTNVPKYDRDNPPRFIDVEQPLEQEANDLIINSDTVFYNKETESFIATGNAEVLAIKEKTRLTADKIDYNPDKKFIIAENNVHLYKNGEEIVGDYMKVDLTKENALISNPKLTTFGCVKLNAKEALVEENSIEAYNGDAFVEGKNYVFLLSANMLGSGGSKIDFKEDNKTSMNKPHYTLFAKDVDIVKEPERKILKLKGASIITNDQKKIKLPPIELSADNELKRIEIAGPEIGYNKEMGLYTGWGKVFYLPGSATFKVAPVIAAGGSEGDAGVGAMARFMSKTNVTEAGYTSGEDSLTLKGKQEFGDKVSLLYGRRSYIDDGISSFKKANLLLDLVYDETYKNDKLNLSWNFRNSIGYAEDYNHTKNYDFDENNKEAEPDINKHWGTTRFRTQGHITTVRPLWELNFKDKSNISLRPDSQYALSLYGSGDDFAIMRAGPVLEYNIPEKFETNLSYYFSAIHGESPFNFDRYAYGKSTFNFYTKYYINKKVDIGYGGTFNLNKINAEEPTMPEHRVYVRYGPEDFKVKVGYDFRRKEAVLGFDLMVGTENSNIKYKKMKIKQTEGRLWPWQRWALNKAKKSIENNGKI